MPGASDVLVTLTRLVASAAIDAAPLKGWGRTMLLVTLSDFEFVLVVFVIRPKSLAAPVSSLPYSTHNLACGFSRLLYQRSDNAEDGRNHQDQRGYPLPLE